MADPFSLLLGLVTRLVAIGMATWFLVWSFASLWFLKDIRDSLRRK